MSDFDFSNNSHRRYNPLTDEWILVSPHRAQRPWLGQQEPPSAPSLPDYDPACYLCPSNTRATGERNPAYDTTFVFVNDYSAVKTDQPDYYPPTVTDAADDTAKLRARLLKVQGARGSCFVLCFSPKHNLTLPLMSPAEIEAVVATWTALYQQLQRETKFRFVQIFENKGASMGCSNPHPHCQAWCTDAIPSEPAQELISLRNYAATNHACLLCDYLSLELTDPARVVLSNSSFVVLVPFWAIWPFETLVLAREHRPSLNEFTAAEKTDLADVIRRLTIKYDNLFSTSFPYSMGLHQAPIHSEHDDEVTLSHFHMHYYPPLLRSATVRKFLVGYEMLGEAQRDLTPEQAAERIRAAAEVHYSVQP
ncbi:galactose-1-phosphate uridyl transferase [Limtongia smithiae]|uniref:galactose-1-phosphate uridyl transferase n=1 Tax=Limtongia smithiae TaxID=1125753 RepID=UPI0034CF9DA9